MRNSFSLGSLGVVALSVVLLAQAPPAVPKTKSVDGTRVYIVSPKNGDTVSSPFTVIFGLKGMGVAPAGVNTVGTGHHHLLVDVAQMPNFNEPLPNNDRIRHFGGGQTEVDLTLPAGRHTLQLVFADALHIPHEKPIVSEKITITVR